MSLWPSGMASAASPRIRSCTFARCRLDKARENRPAEHMHGPRIAVELGHKRQAHAAARPQVADCCSDRAQPQVRNADVISTESVFRIGTKPRLPPRDRAMTVPSMPRPSDTDAELRLARYEPPVRVSMRHGLAATRAMDPLARRR